MAIIDCILYNGEAEIFDIRYNILKDFVSEFVVCECPITFSGKEKPLLFPQIQDKYKNVKYYVIDRINTKEEIEQAENSPNTIGAKHWVQEFLIKEQIKKALTHLKDEDIVFIGDCDEIWNPLRLENVKQQLRNQKWKSNMIVYTYFLNQKSSEKWNTGLITKYGNIKNNCLNHLRTDDGDRILIEGGFHFTSMVKSLKQKLKDSYTDEDYATDEILDSLDENIKNDKDFLGRDFKYTKDESSWPQYLKDNREKYKHLMKP